MECITPIITLKNLKKCEPEKVLGRGGFGNVNLARHEIHGLVAIKWQRRIASGFMFNQNK